MPVPGLETGNFSHADELNLAILAAGPGRAGPDAAPGVAPAVHGSGQGPPAGAAAASCGTCSRRRGPGQGFVPAPAGPVWPADATSLARSDCRSDLPRLGRQPVVHLPPRGHDRLLRTGLGPRKLRPDGSLRRAHRLLWTRQWTVGVRLRTTGVPVCRGCSPGRSVRMSHGLCR